MGIVRGIGHAIGAAAALAILAGCSGGSSQLSQTPAGQTTSAGTQSSSKQLAKLGHADNSLLPPNVARITNAPVGTPSFMEKDALGKALVFVSDAANNVVNIYVQAGKQRKVGQIGRLDEPQGLTLDAKGNLYVANTNDSNVLVYAPPYTSAPALTIPDDHEFPVDVAVASTGLVAVTNICSAPQCPASTGSVSLYAKGHTKACATLSDATFNFARVMFAAFDKAGTLYVDGLNAGYQTSIGVVSGGCKAASLNNIALIYTIGFPGGLQIDDAGRIAIVDPVRTQVATFDPPAGGQFGNPTSTTPLTGSTNPLGIALLASGSSFYTADPAGAGVSSEYAYTAGGAPLKSIAVGGQPVGVAVTPPLQP